jgi:hypothetical protein
LTNTKRRRAVVMFALSACLTSTSAYGQLIVEQKALGERSVNIVGDGNRIYQVDPELLATLKVMADQLARTTAALDTRDNELSAKAAELAMAEAKIHELEKLVRRAGEQQKQIDALPDSPRKAEADRALRKANFERVDRLLTTERDSRTASIGLTAYGLAFDSTKSLGGAAGIVGEIMHTPFISTAPFGIRFSWMYDFVGGAYNDNGQAAGYLNACSSVGPSFRLGAPTGFDFAIYYPISFLIHGGMPDNVVPFTVLGGELAANYFDGNFRMGLFLRYLKTDVLIPGDNPIGMLGIRIHFLQGTRVPVFSH